MGAVTPFFKQSATAIGRSMSDRLAETVSVKDYGAVGDDTAADDAAILAAIAKLATSGGTVTMPPGTYRYSTDLDIPRNVSLVGSGSDSCILHYVGSGKAITTSVSSGKRGMNFKGFKLWMTGSTSTHGFYFQNPWGVSWDDVYVFVSQGHGIEINSVVPSNSAFLTFNNVWITDCGGSGILFSGNGGVAALFIGGGCHFQGNVRYGIESTDSLGITGKIFGCATEGDLLGEIYIDRAVGLELSGVYVECTASGKVPIVLGAAGSTSGTAIRNCVISGVACAYMIKADWVNATHTGLVIEGNVISGDNAQAAAISISNGSGVIANNKLASIATLNVFSGSVNFQVSSGAASGSYAGPTNTAAQLNREVLQGDLSIAGRYRSDGDFAAGRVAFHLAEVETVPATTYGPSTGVLLYCRDGILKAMNNIGVVSDLTSGITNLIRFPDSFSAAYWTTTLATVSANTIASPTGFFDADSLLDNSTNSNHYVTMAATIAVDSNQYTTSVYMKSNGKQWAFIMTSNAAGDGDLFAFFDLTNGVTGGHAGNQTTSIADAGGGWWKCSVVRTLTSGTINARFGPAASDGSLGYVGAGATGVYLWRAAVVKQ